MIGFIGLACAICGQAFDFAFKIEANLAVTAEPESAGPDPHAGLPGKN